MLMGRSSAGFTSNEISYRPIVLAGLYFRRDYVIRVLVAPWPICLCLKHARGFAINVSFSIYIRLKLVCMRQSNHPHF